MPVRFRITLLFTLLVFVILGLVCIGIYYFSSSYQVDNIRVRLTNRAITTARFLSQSDVFDATLIRKIDSATTLSIKDKSIQAYTGSGRKIYAYSDVPGDTVAVVATIIEEARKNNQVYFKAGRKEAVAYYYQQSQYPLVIVTAAYDEVGETMLRQLKWILMLCFCVGLMIAFAGGHFFSARLLKPVIKITDEVNEISATEFTRRVHTGNTRDEWHYLASTLNELLNRLQESFEMQSRFISNASHELSTPLTSISSQLEVSIQRERTAAEYRATIQSVYEDVRQLSKLTQTLLEFAKASGNRGGLEIGPVRIDEILLRLPSEIAKLNERYSVSIEFNELPEDEDKLLVYGNEELLFTAIKNIMLNACKYSDDHHAAIELSIANSEINITIEDKGIGIPQHEIRHIFQPFYRVEENVQGGFGLGLSLAQRIVKLHNGQISVQSEEGEGTVFTIRFPISTKVGVPV